MTSYRYPDFPPRFGKPGEVVSMDGIPPVESAKMEDITTSVQASCGHPIEVRFPEGIDSETRIREIQTIQTLTCAMCVHLRHECEDDARMDRLSEHRRFDQWQRSS